MKLRCTILAALMASGASFASAPAAYAGHSAPQVRAEDDAFLIESKNYAAATKKWRDERRAAAKESPEKEAEVRARHPVHGFWPRMEALADDGDGRALAWMVEASSDRHEKTTEIVALKDQLLARLFEQHRNGVWAATGLVELIARQRSWYDEGWVRTKLSELAEKSTHKEVSAAAYAELAQRLSTSKATAEDRKRAEELLAKIEKDFADTNAARQLAIKREAGAYEVGGTPGDFDAVDPDGVAFKLSDYRGKVVLLDFWGFW